MRFSPIGNSIVSMFKPENTGSLIEDNYVERMRILELLMGQNRIASPEAEALGYGSDIKYPTRQMLLRQKILAD